MPRLGLGMPISSTASSAPVTTIDDFFFESDTSGEVTPIYTASRKQFARNNNDVILTSNVTKDTSIAVPPGQTGTAIRVIETTATGQHFGGLVIDEVTAGDTYTMSLYVKSTYSSIRIYTNTTEIASNLTVNFTNGTVTLHTGLRAGIEDAGGGWYRINWTQVAQASGTSSIYLVVKDLSSYTGSTSNFTDYFGLQSEGVNPAGFTTVHGTFYLGQDCSIQSYCSSTSGIASFIAADGTETNNWQKGRNPWNCCVCICAGPFPDTSCSSWCANTAWGGQEQINYGLAHYDEYTGKCWYEAPPYDTMANMAECKSALPLGYTKGGTCWWGPCREYPQHDWLIHGCHADNPCNAAQVWVNHFCCCGRCSYESNSIDTMAICRQYTDTQCGHFLNWYALTSNQPSVVVPYFCCTNC